MAKVRKKYDITAREGVKFCAVAIFFLLPQALFRGVALLVGLACGVACGACLWDGLWAGVAYPCPSLRFVVAKSFSLDAETLD